LMRQIKRSVSFFLTVVFRLLNQLYSVIYYSYFVFEIEPGIALQAREMNRQIFFVVPKEPSFMCGEQLYFQEKYDRINTVWGSMGGFFAMKTNNKKHLLWILILVILFFFASCEGLNQLKEPFSTVISAQQPTIRLLEVETKNGRIEIRQWDESFIKVEGEKTVNGLGDLESHLEKIEIKTVYESDQLFIYASFPEDLNKLFNNISYGARFMIYIPEELSALEEFEIKTSNGKIDMEGFAGIFDLRTSNGSIHLSDCSGSIKANTSNAAVELADVQAQMDITTSNGYISFSKCFLTGSTNRFSTSNGRINGNVTLPSSGHVSFITSNGYVHLSLPENTNADFITTTSNGNISIKDFRVIYTSDQKTKKTGRMNNSGVHLVVQTSNGNITIDQ